jgi:hypothetical protein
VFAEGSTYRGRLKSIARNIVASEYRAYLDPKFTGGNQAELYNIVKENVAKLLSKGFFLQGGKDEDVGSLFLLIM